MLLIAGIIVLLLGAVFLISPTTWWHITESWKSYSAGDPSELYIKLTRVLGGFIILVGIASIVCHFLA